MIRINALLLLAAMTTLPVIANDGSARQDLASASDPRPMVIDRCVLCHGTGGRSESPLWPSLAGQQKDYLASQLATFAEGNKGTRRNPEGAQMYDIAALMSEPEIKQVSAYYSGQERRRVKGVKATDCAAGKEIYFDGPDDHAGFACATCHGANGEGRTELRAPMLAGQHSRYLVKQLEAFATGARSDPVGNMRSVAQALSEEQRRQLSTFLESMPCAAPGTAG